MKQFFVVFLIGFLAFRAFGQPSVDIGVFGGAGTYFGDMTKIEFQKSVNPVYGGFLRYNFNPRYGLRFNVINGTIGATGEFINSIPEWKFSKNVVDISLQFEWNYLKYIVGDRDTRWSTFLYGGIGVQMYSYVYDPNFIQNFVDPRYFDIAHSSSPVTSPIIPFGMGFKYNLGKRWGIGLEGGLRKTFSDKLDNLDDPLSYKDGDVIIKYTDQLHNNDWTAYAGVHLVYKMIYKMKGWELRTPRDRILDWGIFNGNRKE
jgi:hypothetical protein